MAKNEHGPNILQKENPLPHVLFTKMKTFFTCNGGTARIRKGIRKTKTLKG